jgi:hypothetical protein
MSTIDTLSGAAGLSAGKYSANKAQPHAAASRNYSFAKVIAILTVTAGHWFTGTILWIPVTFGLFVFAFSSGYFTSARYGERVERTTFWRRKLERLGLRYWIILAFITAVLVWEGRAVWHWHSLVHAFGLSGFLNWAAIPNQSALGAGLWFFTLLLIFYLAYPYLVRAVRTTWAASVVLMLGFVLAVVLEERVKVGHELWLTAFGFIAGVAWGVHRPSLSARWMLCATVVLWLALLVLNVGGIKAFNTVLIAAGAMAVAVWLTVATLPAWSLIDRVAALDQYLLEIFLIHMYLFSRPTGHSVLDYFLSLGLILAASIMLGYLADRLSALLFGRAGR